jgi:hypothetical protein
MRMMLSFFDEMGMLNSLTLAERDTWPGSGTRVLVLTARYTPASLIRRTVATARIAAPDSSTAGYFHGVQ